MRSAVSSSRETCFGEARLFGLCACGEGPREARVSGGVRHRRGGPGGSGLGLVELGCRAGLGAKMEFDDGVVECHRRMCLFGVQGGAIEKVEEARRFDGRVVRGGDHGENT